MDFIDDQQAAILLDDVTDDFEILLRRRDESADALNRFGQERKEVGSYFRGKLEELKNKYAFIGEVRGMGLMQALELIHPDKSPNPQAVAAVFEKTRDFGLLIGKGGLWGHVIRLGPALTCSKNDIDEAVKALDRAFATVAQA